LNLAPESAVGGSKNNEIVPGILEVRMCPHGRGIFALRPFHEGETVSIVAGGKVVRLPTSTKGYALRIGDDLYWDEIEAGEPSYWSNFLDHSDMANCKFLDIDVSLPSARLVATREISKGDELFLNYRDYHPGNPVF
jgi:hypothetical protein